MLQFMDIGKQNGKQVFVVEFDELPELPITAATLEEAPYAQALHEAIRTKVVTEPGKYAIYVEGTEYEIYTVNE